MQLCAACDSIETGNREATGHASLEVVKSLFLPFNPANQTKVIFHNCRDCGTHWYQQQDPDDPVVGWIPLS